MVSGFLISPYDQERICSGLAMLMRIWSNVMTWPVWPRIFISSFMRSIPFESAGASSGQVGGKLSPSPRGRGGEFGGGQLRCDPGTNPSPYPLPQGEGE